jgi:SET domain
MSVESLEGAVVGSCLDPLAALMNHSCDPNSAFFFKRRELRVQSIRSIAPGEELTISYTNETDNFDHRQKELSSKYFFTCTCSKCQKGVGGPGEFRTGDLELHGRLHSARDALRDLLHLSSINTPTEAIEEAATEISFKADPSSPWPCDVQPVPMLQYVLAKRYQETDPSKAYLLWFKICFETEPAVYPNQYNLRRVGHFLEYIGVEG